MPPWAGVIIPHAFSGWVESMIATPRTAGSRRVRRIASLIPIAPCSAIDLMKKDEEGTALRGWRLLVERRRAKRKVGDADHRT